MDLDVRQGGSFHVPMSRPLSTLFLVLALGTVPSVGATPPVSVRAFLERHCLECHDSETRKGGLDLEHLPFEPDVPTHHTRWVALFDRVAEGDMPPPRKPRPSEADRDGFLGTLTTELAQADLRRSQREGRTVQRRLNRYEYENALRDLFDAPWLQLRESLPEDGLAHRFNKSGERLDVSHVQMARYLSTAEEAMRQVIAGGAPVPATRTVRYRTRDEGSYTGPMKFSVFNTAPERATFPVLGFEGQPKVRSGDAPMSVGPGSPELRDLEGVGVVAGSYEPLEPKFGRFRAPMPGKYRLRFLGHSVWVGPGVSNRWYIPDLDAVSKGRRTEPVTVYSETPPHQLRRLGTFDVSPEPEVRELETWLLAGETIRVDPGRLFRSRPGPDRWRNPLAERDGQPGVVFRWMEVEGPIREGGRTAGMRRLFGDLPIAEPASPGELPRVLTTDPLGDARRLLREFLQAAYRRPGAERHVPRFLPVVRKALDSGQGFADAMVAGYTAVLCSPEFLCLHEEPGRLDASALASRLSLFLWNSVPDADLRATAESGALLRREVLHRQVDRLLDHPNSGRFVEAFLDYWLDLRRIQATSPDPSLYGDYYLDDLLAESALEETRAFFAELLRGDLPAANLVDSDFAMLNERLARHYDVPAPEGIALRKTSLPRGGVRGGLLTQAAVLKVTSNGTTTSPVLRGAWIMDRLLGQPPPPPPPGVPAVEPDIRGAATIRQQLEKHRSQESCAACHRRIDPAGFALESFDVMGGFRERYRALGPGTPAPGLAFSGQKFEFHAGLPVDASGELPDGRTFQDIRELKRRLLTDERQIARNLLRQWVTYSTGSPARFGDRSEVEAILDRTQGTRHGLRSLIHALVDSPLFQNK